MFSEKAGSVSQSIKIGLVFIAVMICACSLAQGQDTEQQLQLLKQQYEETTKEFEQRISALEQQIEKEKIENKSKINQNTKSPYSTSPSLRSGVTPLEQLVKSHPIWFLPHLDRQSASHLLRYQEPGVCFF